MNEQREGNLPIVVASMRCPRTEAPCGRRDCYYTASLGRVCLLPGTVNALYDTDPHATVVATGSQVSDVNEAYTRGRAEGFDAAIAWQKNILQRWAKLAEETKQILEGSLS